MTMNEWIANKGNSKMKIIDWISNKLWQGYSMNSIEGHIGRTILGCWECENEEYECTKCKCRVISTAPHTNVCWNDEGRCCNGEYPWRICCGDCGECELRIIVLNMSEADREELKTYVAFS